MKKSLSLIAGALLAVTTLSVSAQEARFTPGVYLGVDAGLTSAGQNRGAPGYRTTSERRVVGFMRGAVGYQFSRNLALESGYFGTGDVRFDQTNGVRNMRTSADAQGTDFAAVFKLTEGLPGLLLKGGLTYARVSGSSTDSAVVGGPARQSNFSNSGVGYLFGVGYELDLSHHWSANATYTRYQRVAGLSGARLGVLSAGVKYRF